jgi:hypothetical protein
MLNHFFALTYTVLDIYTVYRTFAFRSLMNELEYYCVLEHFNIIRFLQYYTTYYSILEHLDIIRFL